MSIGQVSPTTSTSLEELGSRRGAGVELFRTTSGTIAMTNLAAQIDSLSQWVTAGLPSVHERAELIELVAQRGHILGSIADMEMALAMAEALRADQPENGTSWLTRGRARARFHLFDAALVDLAEGVRRGANVSEAEVERATILLALGHFDQARTILEESLSRHADFNSLAALASYHADCGSPDLAEPLFDRCRDVFRGVSPIPLALLDFQRGHMWMREGASELSRHWLASSVALLPRYAPAQGHLAEVEADLGEVDAAVARLLPLTRTSDDPDYAATLARILVQAGRMSEAAPWFVRAGRGYEDLVSSHPAAFADHAAFFWLEAGDPCRAHQLAQYNFSLRQTPRAATLAARAAKACGARSQRDPRQ
jgi:tetratricopeptide (TPR) repeat protein